MFLSTKKHLFLDLLFLILFLSFVVVLFFFDHKVLHIAAECVDSESIKVILEFPNDDKNLKCAPYDWDNFVNFRPILGENSWNRGYDIFKSIFLKNLVCGWIDIRLGRATIEHTNCMKYLFDIQKERYSKGIYKAKMNILPSNMGAGIEIGDIVERIRDNPNLADLLSQNLYQYIDYQHNMDDNKTKVDGNVIIKRLYYEREESGIDFLYYFAKNGSITMFEHLIKMIPKCVTKIKSYCDKKHNLRLIDIAQLYNQTKCVNWLKEQYFQEPGQQPRVVTDQELGVYLKFLQENKHGGQRFVELVNEQKKHDRNWSKIFDKSSSHLAHASWNGQIEVVKTILSIGGDPNTTKSSLVAAYNSRDVNSVEICKLLLKSGADPNIVYKDENPLLRAAVNADNVELLQALFDNSNKIRFKWDNVKLNYKRKYSPKDSIFDFITKRYQKQNKTAIDMLNYLFDIKEMNKDKEEFQDAIRFGVGNLSWLLKNPKDFPRDFDRTKTMDDFNIDINEFDFYYGFLDAILRNIHHCDAQFFAKMVECSMKEKGKNYVMFLLAKHGNSELISKVVKLRENMDNNTNTNTNTNTNSKDEKEAETEKVKEKEDNIDEYYSTMDEFFNGICYQIICSPDASQKVKSMTPIQVAYHLNHVKALEWMFNCDKFIESDMLDLFIQQDLNVFKSELYTLVTQLKINNWDQLQSKIFNNENKMRKWIYLTKINVNKLVSTHERETILSFLHEMNSQVFETRNFDKLLAMIGPNSVQLTMNDNWYQYRRDQKIGDYIYKQLTKLKNEKKNSNILDTLGDIINQGISTNECPFTDSWLILSKLINQEKFLEAIEKCATLGMPKVELNKKKKKKKSKAKQKGKEKDKQEKSDKNQVFFKNFVLNSNVFAEPLELKSKQEMKQVAALPSSPRLVFDVIESNIIEAQLLKQKEYIRDEIIKLENEWSKDWEAVKNIQSLNTGRDINIQQNTLEYGIPCKYENQLELPKSGVNQFNGAQIYDEYEYLTALLIRSHLINPSFQKSCKNIFSKKYDGCFYTPGSVKLRGRCIVKARIDYNDKPWPKTSNILDFLRCSIVCDNPKILNQVIQDFIDLINKNNDGSIKKILRIKNGLENVSSNMNLKQFTYGDIKFNVLVQFRDQQLIGEVQFIPKFMLEAKKIGHSFYAFQRRQEYYQGLYLLNNKIHMNENNFIENLLQTQILSRNKNLFSQLLHLLFDNELNMIRQNKEHILNKIKQNDWQKGEKIFLQTL